MWGQLASSAGAEGNRSRYWGSLSGTGFSYCEWDLRPSLHLKKLVFKPGFLIFRQGAQLSEFCVLRHDSATQRCRSVVLRDKRNP